MMAVCDSVTGFVAICHAFVCVSYRFIDKANPFIYVVYVILQSGTRTSLFYNTLLTVVRTINIVNPFYIIKRHAIAICAIIYPIFWVIIMMIEAYYLHLDEVKIQQLLSTAVPGWRIVFELSGYDYHDSNRKVVEGLILILFMVIPLVLPAMVALICAAIQIWSILKPSVISPPSIKERQMTITIIMLTMLCLVCNIPYTVLLIYKFTHTISEMEILLLFYSLCTVLPFIQTVLNPVILLWHSA